jgi:hypothetical protein
MAERHIGPLQPDFSNAMREAASPRPALSRTIARPNTNPPQPPTACRTRAISKVPIVAAQPATAPAAMYRIRAAISVGRRPNRSENWAVEQLSVGNAKLLERDYLLDRAARHAEIGGRER